MKLTLSKKEHGAIINSINEGTYFQSGGNGGSPKVAADFFDLVKDSTKEVLISSIDKIVRQGRTNRDNIATTDVVWKADVTMKVGDVSTTIRIHLADAIACAKNDGKGIFTFGTYTPEGKSNTYLVPTCAGRCAPIEVLEYLEKEAEVTA